MKYLLNILLIFVSKILGKFKRGRQLNRNIFSGQRVLENNFQRDEEFNFVQVGANDGVSFDFLYDFITVRNSKGVVIEPVTEYFNELVNNYQNFPEIIKINKAVHPCEKEILINRIDPIAVDNYPDWVKGIASLDFEHHKKTGIKSDDIIKEIVKADSLMNIINQNFKHIKIDYLQVDTEGFDFEVIKMIDFKKLHPSILKYEYVNLNTIEQNSLLNLLQNEGYYTFNESGDTIAINLSKIKLY